MKFGGDRDGSVPPSSSAHTRTNQPDDDAPARHGDVETLRRLTREAFGEITTIRDRVRSVERNLATERAFRASDRIRVDTRAGRCVGLGHHDAERVLDTALDCVTTVEAPFPGGDSLTARFSTAKPPGTDTSRYEPGFGEPGYASPTDRVVAGAASTFAPSPVLPSIHLEKLMYRRRLGPNGWLRVAAAGGEGQDAAATLNPFARGRGVSLTTLAASGSPTLNECRGTAMCASYDFADQLVGVSGGIFSGEPDLSGDDAGKPGTEPRRLVQVTARPGTRAAMSLALAEGPRRGANGFGMSAQGLFALGARTLCSAWVSGARIKDGVGVQEDDDDASGGWGLAATAPPVGDDDARGGGFVERARGLGWGVVAGKEPGFDSPVQLEAFLRFGDKEDAGLNTRSACPGIVATRDPESGRWDVAAACRVELRFS